MRRLGALLSTGLALGFAAAQAPPTTIRPESPGLPVVDGRPVVATVNGEPIGLEAFEREIAMLHMAADPEAVAPTRENPRELLDRLINAKLIAQEARESGLDETPELRRQLAQFEDETLRDMLVRKHVAPVKADPAQVATLYKELTLSYRLHYFLLKDEAAARSFFESMKAGANWDAEVRKRESSAVTLDGTALKSYRLEEFLPEIREMVSSLKPGEIHQPSKLRDGWVVIQMTGIEYPENPEARERAVAVATEIKQKEVTRDYIESLRAQHAIIDKPLLGSIDFEKPGALKSLASDTRPLVQIQGEPPITVAELEDGMTQRFFHGLEKAAKGGRINKEKDLVLEDLINRRVIVKEAKRLKLDETTEFRFAMGRREDALLFDAYVKKAIAPNVVLEGADYKAYYAKNKNDFRTPAMIRIESLAFASKPQAEAALDKLRQGSDFRWVQDNAPGRLAPDDATTTRFPGGMVVTATLPAGARKALAGAGKGDFRFYEDASAKRYYVLRVVELVPEGYRSYEEVRGEISQVVAAEKIQSEIEALAVQIRAASDIKIYATGEELKRIVRADLAAEP